MRKFSPRQGHRSLQDLVLRLWRRWMAGRDEQLLEAARLGSNKLEYLTRGLAKSNSGTIKGNSDLLRRRLLALGLDPDELALLDPALFRHLERCCALCGSPDDCASDLAQTSTHRAWQARDDWRDYCENVAALEMLTALRSTPAPKYQFDISP
jgi:hypothetical protein